jgi:MFS family permease
MMGVTTAAIGILPTYASIGVLSPMLLVALRFLQGVALGGEWAGAVLIAVEHGDQRTRGRNASWTQVGPAVGTLMATAFIGLITYVVSPAAFVRWAWRIPPLTSIVIVGVGLWVREGIDETPMFDRLERTGAKAARPIGEVFRNHWRRLLVAGGVRIGSDVFYSLVFVFTLTYLTSALRLSRTLALAAIAIATPFNAISIPYWSAVSDRVGRRPVYAAGAAAATIWTFVFFVLLDTRRPALIVLAVIVGVLIHAAMYGPQAAFVIEQFPTRVRYAGSSLAYTLAGILGAGFAPLIIASLYRIYGTTTAICAYVAGALAVTGTALLAARETAAGTLQD